MARLEVPEPWRGNITAALGLIDDLEGQIAETNAGLKTGHADHPRPSSECGPNRLGGVLRHRETLHDVVDDRLAPRASAPPRSRAWRARARPRSAPSSSEVTTATPRKVWAIRRLSATVSDVPSARGITSGR